MTYRLLALSLLVQVAWSCVPVKPGEDMPCPSVPEAASANGYGKRPFKMANAGGTKTLSCDAPAMLIKVVGGVPTEMSLGSMIICKANSGKYVVNDGTGDKEIGSETYTCGEKLTPCQTCDQSKLMDTSHAACTSNTKIICDSKPTSTPDMSADKCPVLSCAGTARMHQVVSATDVAPVDATMITCDNGVWLVGGNAIPATVAGFACAVDCMDCTTAVNAAYDMAGNPMPPAIPDPDLGARPTCTYKCASGYAVTLANNMMRDTLTCPAKGPTAVMAGADTVSPTSKFKCTMCMCTDPTVLTDGRNGACPKDTLCVPPSGGDNCMKMCPAMATPRFKDFQGVPMMATSITCAGTDWVATGAQEVTCAYAPGAGELTEPPAGEMCMKLTQLSCPSDTCAYANLVYTPIDGGYRVTCKEGSLTTPNSTPGENYIADCISAVGMWMVNGGPFTQATCVTDPTPTQGCLDYMAAGSAATVSCKLGACTMACTDTTKQFQFVLLGMATPMMSANLKCVIGEPYTNDNASPVDMGIACV